MLRIDIKGIIVPNDDAEIYDWLGMENTCPGQVGRLIEQAGGENIDVYIDSGGGDIFAGSDIYSALRSCKGEVKIHVIGLAASAASVIACAAKSDISPTAMIMVHNVSGTASGDYRQMDKTSEILKKANKAIAGAYMHKTGMSEEEALSMMDKETWLTAAEAVEKGLIDEISEERGLLMTAAVSNMLPRQAVLKIKNLVHCPPENNGADFLHAKLKLLKLKGGKENEF